MIPLTVLRTHRDTLNAIPLAREFHEAAGTLTAAVVDTLQINVGRLCNQTCRHCHVDAGPDRREVMSRDTMTACLDAVRRWRIGCVDITGGAPELNPHFRWLVEEASALGCRVIDRCNLTVLTTGRHADLPVFFARHGVAVVCSLPHYRAPLTDAQRGPGVFARSIEALRMLNASGYGQSDPRLRLVLVTNPVGAFLPAGQASLEAEWKRELWQRYAVRFDALYCLTNMPLNRYLEWLIESGNLEPYMERLTAAFNPRTLTGLMCRSLVSVGWDGRLYDCDFNQMLDLPVEAGAPLTIDAFDSAVLARRTIVTDRHCFGCTAGAGSSCGGQVE